MNQKFKSGKKVLSLVLSVLMLMSCLVFAPVANAAETLPKSDVVITIEVTNELVLKSDNGTFTMTLMFSDGTSKVINLFGYDEFTGNTKINSSDWIKEKTTTFTIKDVTAKLTDIYMDMSINKYYDLVLIQGKLVFNLTATQNGETIGTYKFSSKGNMDLFKWYAEVRKEWPPLNVIVHYMKNIYLYCAANDLFDKSFDELNNMDLPFDWRYIPQKYPQPAAFLHAATEMPQVQ